MKKTKCIIVIDVDGTIIPNVIDFEKIRAEVRELIGINHPLKPLGESLFGLKIDEDLKRRAWDLVEKAELESINRIKPEEVERNVDLLKNVLNRGIEILLVTMRSMKTVEPLLRRICLHEFLNNTITRDGFTSRYQQLKYIKETHKESKVVFIGDTDHDEESAKKADVHFIRVRNYSDLNKALQISMDLCHRD
ncbi:MAG: HAD hydrolase-like protein [Desulfurococcaceae archaeon]